jgi:hypothetical protein
MTGDVFFSWGLDDVYLILSELLLWVRPGLNGLRDLIHAILIDLGWHSQLRLKNSLGKVKDYFRTCLGGPSVL